MAELKMRYNPETEEVELVVDNEVALSSGKEEFVSWVDYYTEVHLPEVTPEPVETEEDKLRAQLDEANANLEAARAEVEAAHKANDVTPETPEAPEVDNADEA